ncbi:MAG: D-2-hydroxyacid dehydrogenase [Thermoproteota archaeon]
MLVSMKAKKVNVLIRAELTGKQLNEIRSISKMLRIVACREESEASKFIASSEVVAGWVGEKVLRKARRLKWLHVFSTGVDSLPCRGLMRKGVLVTCSKGAHSIPVAEHALMFMLMLAKHMPFHTRCQIQRRWGWVHTNELRGKTVGVVGFGHIGKEIARQARCLGMRVIATRRTGLIEPGADILLPMNQLRKLLSESDFVVAAAPLTEKTKWMFGEKEFRSMKSEAYFINIARGKLVQERALVKALRNGWIRGAALDVTEMEPTPKDSELYELENLILTPHVSGGSREAFERSLGIFIENLRRYLNGERLLNLVDKKECY